jgi:flavin-dependent dehydrogenase
VVDASGRETLLANQFGSKRKHPRHNSAAIYGHFTGAHRLQGDKRAGNISIFWFPHGWFWFIPLADGSTSIGATCWPYYLKSRDKPLQEFFFDTIAMVPRLAARLQDARLIDGKVHATGNFSYLAEQCCGERWVLLGDAYAFIDPVFSSGVYLAMVGAFAAVDLVNASLDEPGRAAAARRAFKVRVDRGPRVLSWFIFRMTSPALRDLFMQPSNVLRSKEAVLSVLGGDIYGRSPIGPSLAFFKFVYYLGALRHWRRTWAAWRKRRLSIRDLGELPGENVLVRRQ